MLLTLLQGQEGTATNERDVCRSELLGDEKSLETLGLVNGSRLEIRDSNDSSEANVAASTLTRDESTVKKYEAKRGDSGFAKFRKEAAAAKASSASAIVKAEERAEGINCEAGKCANNIKEESGEDEL